MDIDLLFWKSMKSINTCYQSIILAAVLQLKLHVTSLSSWHNAFAESEDIRAIMYDDKAGTVAISGGFDPLVLPCKLRRKAGSVIKDIHLKKEREKNRVPPPPPPPPPQPAPAARAAFGTICGAGVAPGRACLCLGQCRCHCGGGYGCRCCGAAPPCYCVPIGGGGCSVVQFTYDEPSPACSIM